MKVIFLLIIFSSFSKPPQDDFAFSNGDQKITLEINNGDRLLHWNETSVLKLKLKNIEKDDINSSGPGITYKKGQNRKNELHLEITPSREEFQTDTLNLYVSFPDRKNKNVLHKFSVLIK